jgi:hypothetical protein
MEETIVKMSKEVQDLNGFDAAKKEVIDTINQLKESEGTFIVTATGTASGENDNINCQPTVILGGNGAGEILGVASIISELEGQCGIPREAILKIIEHVLEDNEPRAVAEELN